MSPRIYCSRHRANALRGECPRCIQEERDALAAKISALRGEVEDWRSGIVNAMGETPCRDASEHHCSCVPYLRLEIAALREAVREAYCIPSDLYVPSLANHVCIQFYDEDGEHIEPACLEPEVDAAVRRALGEGR